MRNFVPPRENLYLYLYCI